VQRRELLAGTDLVIYASTRAINTAHLLAVRPPGSRL
jgi:hypothetical protein